MADLTITAANVIKGSTGLEVIENGIAGAAIAIGEVVYLDTSDSKWKLAQADGTALQSGSADLGIALNAASADGQPITLIKRQGNLTLGAILTVGQIYCLSAASGKICPYADLTTGDYVVILGLASSTSVLALHFYNSGIEKP